MEQLQQWRYIPAGSGEDYRAVERPPEQQEREAQGEIYKIYYKFQKCIYFSTLLIMNCNETVGNTNYY